MIKKGTSISFWHQRRGDWAWEGKAHLRDIHFLYSLIIVSFSSSPSSSCVWLYHGIPWAASPATLRNWAPLRICPCLHQKSTVYLWVHLMSANPAIHVSSPWELKSQRQASSHSPHLQGLTQQGLCYRSRISIRILFKWHSHIHGARGEHDGQLHTSED